MSCVADREHGRIQCFNIPHGEFQFQILREEFNGRLFSISYSRSQGLLYAVCGPSLFGTKDVSAFIFNITDQKMVGIFAPNSGVRYFKTLFFIYIFHRFLYHLYIYKI